jgi:PhoPQ-activated pathogenicity-related protein
MTDVLRTYVEKEDPNYKWELTSKDDFFGSQVLNINLQSQNWKGIVWSHRLRLVLPKKLKSSFVLLFITGSGQGLEELAICKMFSDSLGLPCAILHDIPNQPLFNGLYEDAIIALTFQKFFETGDEEWPLLLPMTKGAKRAIDATEEVLEKVNEKPRGFIVTGASKRGWTTWLISAVDKRVKGIAPMVFDNLNFQKQMEHQIECYGSYSEQISDYTKLRLQENLKTEKGKKLLQIVDPYSYRTEITIPKLIVNGTNDPYWTVDSLNLYFDDLLGEKYILYVPNAGHGLEDRRRVMNVIMAFTSSIVSNQSLPSIKLILEDSTVALVTNSSPLYVDFWKASSNNMDFRYSKWESLPSIEKDDKYFSYLAKEKTYTALFGEATFQFNNKVFSLSTSMSIFKSNI